jgi:hypothetical protein
MPIRRTSDRSSYDSGFYNPEVYSAFGSRRVSFDSNALTYIINVENADGQPLDDNIKYAINDFVVGCKEDGTWDQINSLGFLAGPSTLSGALVPVKGMAPSSVCFRENVDPDYGSVVLLMRMNGPNGSSASIIDESYYRRLVTSTNSTLSSGVFKYGRSSYDITASNQFLELSRSTSTIYDIVDGKPFTVEAWVLFKSTTDGSFRYILRSFHSAGFPNGGWILTLASNNTFYFNYGDGSSQIVPALVSGAPTYSQNTWHHVAATFDGSALRVFQDGALVRESVVSGVGAPANSSLFVGRNPSSVASGWWNGAIDSIRITRGVARYTVPFTPPSQEFGGNQSDYFKTAGLASNGFYQYLDTNVSGNQFPQDDFSMSVYVSSVHQTISGAGAYIGGGGFANGARNIFRNFVSPNYNGHSVRNTSNSAPSFDPEPVSNRFLGSSRNASGSFISRAGGSGTISSVVSQSPTADNMLLFARGNNSNVDSLHSKTRLSMYVLGNNLDLAALDNRASALFDVIWKPVPQLIGSYIDSDSTTDTTHVLNVPTHAEGDLLIAVLMWREDMGTLTAPSGWNLYDIEMDRLFTASLVDRQHLYVYTKQASSSEPASYTWSATTSTRNAGLMVSVRGGVIDTVSESYGNATTATIDTLPDRLNLTVFTWIYASTTSESYSQSGAGVVQITDSPKAQARLSGGYTTTKGTVTSTHFTTTTTGSPNHGGINIQLVGV